MSDQQMIKNIEQSVQLCQQKAETMLKKYEYVVVDAQTIFQAKAAPKVPVEQNEGGARNGRLAESQISPANFIETTTVGKGSMLCGGQAFL